MVDGTLLINAGSSSVKYRLYVGSSIVLDSTVDLLQTKLTHKQAGELILKHIPKNIHVKKIAHRVVYGAEFKNHVVITTPVMEKLRKSVSLDPLHMPPALALISFFSSLKVKQIACFDTVFHETMPAVAKIYPIPARISKKHGIRRHGFHGLAHQFMMQKALKRYKASKIITCQLGNGISISAIKQGRCIDTSMGFTPLEGVMMGTRSGSIDPSLVAFIAKKERTTPEGVIELLNKESGLKGIAGESDVRELLKRNDVAARLALDMICYQIRKQIGAYIMALDGVDVLVLGGGLAKNKDIVSRILQSETLKDVKKLVVNTDEQAVMFDIAKKL